MLQTSLNLYPESVYARSYTGFCLSALGQYERAIELYDRVLQIQSDSAYAPAQLGRMFMYVGRLKEATEWCRDNVRRTLILLIASEVVELRSPPMPNDKREMRIHPKRPIRVPMIEWPTL